MAVYAREDGTIIWSSVRANHKQGRVLAGTLLSVISENRDWYKIFHPGDLDREVKEGYPNFWVKKADVDVGIEPAVPRPPPVSDIEKVGASFVYLMVWLRELWR